MLVIRLIRTMLFTSFDDGVPPNMVARVMGHEKITTTLQLYTRRTDDERRILDALTDDPGKGTDRDDDGSTGASASSR
jgi:integrase